LKDDSIFNDILTFLNIEKKNFLHVLRINQFFVSNQIYGNYNPDVFGQINVYKEDKVHVTEIVFKGINLITVEIGGFISAVKAIFGIILIPYIYISFEHSISNASKDSKKGKLKRNSRNHMISKFHNHVSFKGIYNLHDIVEQQEKEIEEANIDMIELEEQVIDL